MILLRLRKAGVSCRNFSGTKHTRVLFEIMTLFSPSRTTLTSTSQGAAVWMVFLSPRTRTVKILPDLTPISFNPPTPHTYEDYSAAQEDLHLQVSHVCGGGSEAGLFSHAVSYC